MKFVVLLFMFAEVSVIDADSSEKEETLLHNIPKSFRAAMKKYRGVDTKQAVLDISTREETKSRLRSFIKTAQTIDKINNDLVVGYSAGINFISVMTETEIDAMLNLRPVNRTQQSKDSELENYESEMPNKVNWSKKGALSEIKHQGGCGSSWAFAAASALEGNYRILTKDLVTFSEQEYVDCTYEDDAGRDSCEGGNPRDALQYNIKSKRMALGERLDYFSRDMTCSVDGLPDGLRKARVSYLDESMSGSDLKLAKASSRGIIAVSIKVSRFFLSYKAGIFECSGDCDCSGQPNHAVSIVGYDPGFWIVRNSWGPQWGEGGYVKMSRKQNNICGINSFAIAPVLECRSTKNCATLEDVTKEELFGVTHSPGIQKRDYSVGGFDIGKRLKCGEIYSKTGINHNNSVEMDKSPEKYAVMNYESRENEFCLTDKDYLVDKKTELCLTVDDVTRTDERLRFADCRGAKKWVFGKSADVNIIRLKGGDYDMCWHKHVKPSKTKKEFYSDCNNSLFEFALNYTKCFARYSDDLITKSCGIGFFGPLDESDPYGKWGYVEYHVDKNFVQAKKNCMSVEICEGIEIYPNGTCGLSYQVHEGAPTVKGAEYLMKVRCEDPCTFAGTSVCKNDHPYYECKKKCN